MDKVACCLQINGGPSSRSYPSKPSLSSTTARRSISFFPNRATAGNSVTGRNTKMPSGFSLDIEQYMASNAKAVHEALDRALPAGLPEGLSESMRYSLLGCGKRVRPILAIAACELVGGSAAAAIPVACSVEMVHTWSLIRYDMPCMDDTALRRGRPANHVAFGEYASLYSGGTLLATAFGHLARGCTELGAVPAERVLQAMAELGNAAGVGGVAAGLFADKAASEGEPVSLAMLEYIHLHKTARIFEATAVCGAIVGGGTDDEIESVRRYARSVGLLFQQVVDDQAAEKATYQKLLGVDEAQAYAAQLLVTAEGELAGFNADLAAPLHHLARFIAYMNN